MVFARQGVQVLTRDIDTDDTQENFLDVTTVDNTGIDKQNSTGGNALIMVRRFGSNFKPSVKCQMPHIIQNLYNNGDCVIVRVYVPVLLNCFPQHKLDSSGT